MAGQLATYGAQALVNTLGGIVPPAIQSTVPTTGSPTWVPGLRVVDTTTSALYDWNGSAWVLASTLGLYVALLTSDPTQAATQNGGYAVSISDLVEDATSGYARQSVTFAEPPAYNSGTTYVLGQQVFYSGYLYQLAITSSTGTAPSGSAGVSTATWTYVSNGYPAVISNSNVLTWTYSAAQALPVGWAALVTAASGTSGLLKYLWQLPAPQQVQNSQSIQIGVGSLTLGQS